MPTNTGSEVRRFVKPALIVGCLVAAVAVYLLWEEHESHILGALFWLLLLACPAVHFFMHGKHGHGGGQGEDDESAKRSGP